MNEKPLANPSLRELQLWMRWLIVDPRGVEEALSEPAPKIETYKSRYTRPGEDLLPVIQGSPLLPRSDRLSIYAEGYFARLAETLSADFVSLQKILGEESLLKLLADYLKAHPSSLPNIAEVGQHLPHFLKNYEMTREHEYLEELAALEWAVIESFYGDDFPKINPDALKNIPAETWPDARFILDSSVKILNYRWPVNEIWNQRKSQNLEDVIAQFSKKDSWLLVFREESGSVLVRSIDQASFQVLEWMQERIPLGEICERLSTMGDLPPLMEWFSGWVHDGIVRKIEFQERP